MSHKPFLSIGGDKSIDVHMAGRGKVEVVIDFHANGTRESILLSKEDARSLGARLIVARNLQELAEVVKAEQLAREEGEPAGLRHGVARAEPTAELKPLGLVEDRTREQLEADGDGGDR